MDVTYVEGGAITGVEGLQQCQIPHWEKHMHQAVGCLCSSCKLSFYSPVALYHRWLHALRRKHIACTIAVNFGVAATYVSALL